ncbi:helix-turn-helix and ligand-binding sensor domain-containing protein [Spongiivirga citrea]|uniref:LuxR family transcriptional regulator n=1 Tax=Spongiivirga citrea TaxID=1481457 RepID=A0A6M0CM52_9FLAO|nr:LuxR C-terminal-related transcriptional regulator [Spongiivirga citrea]NER19018.1 LuxR family transcriptional regulator [Spongiivirga citrea]
MRFFCAILIFGAFQFVFGQELPPVQNFYPKDYHSENQNWSISQSDSKLIYVANSKGLLEFNGASWQLYPSPNETIMRSVYVVNDRIYTGCFMQFGYWTKTTLGILSYTSLSDKIASDLLEDEEFWNIIALDDSIIFQSLKRIYVYNVKDQSFTTIDSKNKITKIFKAGKRIYFQRLNEGLFKIEYGRDVLVFDDEIVKEDEVIAIFEQNGNQVILTQHNGFYKQEDGILVFDDRFPNNILSKESLYDGIQLDDGNFVLGTIANGLIYIDDVGEIAYQLDQDRGLANNTVLALYEDVDSNIWLGLDNGISYINTKSLFTVFNDNKGILGSIYASVVYNGNLYLGTNQGLFYRKFDSNDEFKFIENTQGQVWFLKEISGTLFCGHNTGTYEVKGDAVVKIAGIEGTWKISTINNRPDLLLQGNYDGLYVLKQSNSSWTLRNKIKNFNNSVRYFELLNGLLFVNHEYNGVFKMEIDTDFYEARNVTIDTTIKGSNSGMIKYNNELLYAYKKGIFKYDATNKKFIKDDFLSGIYTEDEYESGKLVLDEKDNLLWGFAQTNISFIEPSKLTNTANIRSVPLTKEMRKGILGYESITRLGDQNSYLLGTTSGYINLDVDKMLEPDFEVHISSISNRDIKEKEGLLNKNDVGDFKNNENDIVIKYYTPEFNKYIATYYQFQLEGTGDDWSDWSETSTSSFENLSYGDYVFSVKAKIGNKVSNNTATYSFSIAKPWYISNLMLVLYAIGIVLFSFFMHTNYRRYYRKQREKLILKNKQELQLAQAENEKEIIQIKNEQLKKENKSKSKELAASTMSIVKKNELLTTIKNELDKIDDKNVTRSVVKIINANLNESDDWEFFKKAFNNADSKFLKKLKKVHPSLSPNDLKLCAYLRLNLSSKEIAQLFHISPRSVEIKRYRLRKKMDLKHEENLVNYILKL